MDRRGDTAGKGLAHLTCDSGERTSISFGGSGPPVNITTVRLTLHGRELTFEPPIWPIAREPLEVVLLSESRFNLFFGVIAFDEAIPPRGSVAAVEGRPSRLHETEVEIVDNEILATEDSPFESFVQALPNHGQPRIALRCAVRRLSLFETRGRCQ
jgi:hypothetical protein